MLNARIGVACAGVAVIRFYRERNTSYLLVDFLGSVLYRWNFNGSQQMTLRNSKGLFDYQIPHAEAGVSILEKNRYALDMSDPGTGKTYTAVAICRELRLTPAIVCPKSVVPAWERVLKSFGIRPYFLTNWEGAKTTSFKHGSFNMRTGVYTWNLGRTKILLILDEVHKAKGVDSQNSAMLIAAKAQDLITLCLSATAADNPRDMRGLGYRLDLHDLVNFKAWSEEMGCYQDTQGRDERIVWRCTDVDAAMLAVHKAIYPAKAFRMRIADLGDRFPETQITADLYEIKGWKKQNEAFETLVEEIKALQKEAKEGWPSAALTLNMRYRQLTEHLKVDTLTALIHDYLENKKSIAVFVNYTETLFELAKRFPKASLIHGGQTRKGERENEIQAFQTDKSRVIVCNIKAGGVGVSLHDINGRYGRVSLICPTYSAQDLIQAAGRVHRAGGMSKSLQRIIYAKGTVEEEMCRKVAQRVASIQALNDGDLREHDIMGFKTPIPFEESET